MAGQNLVTPFGFTSVDGSPTESWNFGRLSSKSSTFEESMKERSSPIDVARLSSSTPDHWCPPSPRRGAEQCIICHASRRYKPTLNGRDAVGRESEESRRTHRNAVDVVVTFIARRHLFTTSSSLSSASSLFVGRLTTSRRVAAVVALTAILNCDMRRQRPIGVA